jgi:hypothetical protein
MPGISRTDSAQAQAAIRRRASQICNRSGAVEDRDAEHRYRVKAELRREKTVHRLRRAVVIKIQGVDYTVQYECSAEDGYAPGEWKVGDPIPIRVAGNKLYLRRRNGHELQATIVKGLAE